MSHTTLPTPSPTALTATAAVLLLAVNAFAAQPPQTTAAATSAAADAITLKGCVAESMGRYMLNDAVIVKPVPTPVPSAAADPAQKSSADNPIYELVGPQVKAHVGHQVEIVGTMRPRTANADTQAAERTAHPMAGTVTLKTVTMLASTCR